MKKALSLVSKIHDKGCKFIVDQLVKNGRVTRGYVGVYIQEITQELADSFKLKTPQGALVTKVEKGSPAEKAGLQTGDVIVAADGRQVTSSVSLPMIISAKRPGTQTELTVIRDGKEMKVPVTVGTNEKAEAANQATTNAHRLGVSVRALTTEERKTADTEGLFVEKAEGLAARSGILPGDIIVSANGKLLRTPADLQQACEKPQVLLLVQREGGRIFVPIRFGQTDGKK